MAYISTDLATVQAARLRGIRTVAFADRTVTYQSDAEMRQVELDIRAQLAETNARPKQYVAVAGKGLGSGRTCY